MNLQHYLTVIKSIQTNIIIYLDREDNIEENFQNIIKIFDDEKILENLNKIKLIFHLLLELTNNHYRLLNFFSKIERIFLYFKDSMTVLYKAIELNDVKIINLLLSNPNIDVNEKTIKRVSYNEIDGDYIKMKSALHLAVLIKNIEIIKLLMMNENIDVNIKDEQQKTPIELTDNDEIKSLLNRL